MTALARDMPAQRVSAALGMAVARDMSGGKENIVALVGDAAFTNGISFEALNNIAAQTRRMIVVLNDNAWSIDMNVGAIAEYFHKIVTNPTVSSLHDRAAGLLERFGGKTVRHCGTQGGGGGQGADRTRDAVRGVRAELLRTAGWTQPAAADRDVQVPEAAESAGGAARDYAEGQGVRAGDHDAEEVPRLGPYNAETGETKAVGQKTYSEIFAESLTAAGHGEREGGGDYGGDCRMGRRSTCFGRSIRPGTSTWGSRRSMR